VATIQPAERVVGAVGVVVGVDISIFLLVVVRGFSCSVDHNFPADRALSGSGRWWAQRLHPGSPNRRTQQPGMRRIT
jgi:hypothetical protein